MQTMKAVMAVAAGALLCISVVLAAEQESTKSRQDEVALKGGTVMPFDLMRTTHFFDDTPGGGIETITANDKKDARQIALIRLHLVEEAKRFRRGDFSDPAKIHGQDIPGLDALASAGDKLQVKYRNFPAGASLSYASADAAVIAGVHAWFAAQRSDHAAHSHMHP
jgi:hypothetical protein